MNPFSRPSSAIPLLGIITTLVTVQAVAAQGGDHPVCDSRNVSLGPTESWSALVEPGEVHCLEIRLEPGEFLRAVVSIEARPPLTGARAQVFGPNDTLPVVQATLGNHNRRALSLRSRQGGSYNVVIRDAWTIDRAVSGGVPIRVWIEAVEPPALASARSIAIASDPRVDWLREHVQPLHGPEESEDLSDLEPLRGMLEGVRVVLLGESDHYAGSDFAARSRIVRFLHRELGFDVLAMEAGIFGMAAADEAMRAGRPPGQAFALGAWRFWSQAEQMQPLIEYVGQTTKGPRPLRLAGFDIQFIRPGAAEKLPAELAAFLAAHGIASPLTAAEGDIAGVLTALSLMQYRTGERSAPDTPTRNAFLDAMRDALAQVTRLGGNEAWLWSRVLRSTLAEAELNFARADGIDLWEASRLRNAMMAENLIALAEERFPDSRIVAWAGNAHVMRLSEIPPAAGVGPSLGLAVRQHFGDASFVIAATSFEGPNFAADQRATPDIEVLMAEAGFETALLDLRAAPRNSWVSGPFLARAATQAPEERVWRDALDALLFIKTYEPSRPVR
jgi:erythromycin esterase